MVEIIHDNNTIALSVFAIFLLVGVAAFLYHFRCREEPSQKKFRVQNPVRIPPVRIPTDIVEVSKQQIGKIASRTVSRFETIEIEGG